MFLRMLWRRVVQLLLWPLWWPLAIALLFCIVLGTAASSRKTDHTNVTMWRLACGLSWACFGAAWRER